MNLIILHVCSCYIHVMCVFSNSLRDLLSGLYAMSLIVMGATLPVAKVFSSEISIDTYEVSSRKVR